MLIQSNHQPIIIHFYSHGASIRYSQMMHRGMAFPNLYPFTPPSVQLQQISTLGVRPSLHPLIVYKAIDSFPSPSFSKYLTLSTDKTTLSENFSLCTRSSRFNHQTKMSSKQPIAVVFVTILLLSSFKPAATSVISAAYLASGAAPEAPVHHRQPWPISHRRLLAIARRRLLSSEEPTTVRHDGESHGSVGNTVRPSPEPSADVPVDLYTTPTPVAMPDSIFDSFTTPSPVAMPDEIFLSV